MDDNDIDATQVLDLGYDVHQEEPVIKKEVGNLKILSHKLLSEQICPVYEGTNIIGRDGRSDIIIKLQSLSKKHACIEVTDGTYVLYDFDSRNKSRKGEMLLKPYVRYELKDGDLLTFGDLNCEFIACPSEDLDETKSLSGSETGSESLIPEDEEEILHLSDDANSLVNNKNISVCAEEREQQNVSSLSDYIIMPTQCQKEDVNSSGLSDSVILPTQESNDQSYTKSANRTFSKSNLCEEKEQDIYAADSEPEDSEERGNTPPEPIVETPGFALGQRTKSCVSESPLVENESSNEGSVLLESPLAMAESKSNKNKKELNFHTLGSNTNNFVHNVVFRTPPRMTSALTNVDQKVSSDDEEIAGTYIFDTSGFVGEFEDGEDSEENIEAGVMDDDVAIDPINEIANVNMDEKVKEDNGHTILDNVAIDPVNNIVDTNLEVESKDYMETVITDKDDMSIGPIKDIATSNFEEESQIIGYTSKKGSSSFTLDSCRSLETPASSIARNLYNSEEVVDDSEDMLATQPYQMCSPKGTFNSPIKDNLKTKTQTTLCTLPGASLYYDKIDNVNANNYDDVATQLYENQNDTPVGTGIIIDTYFDAVDTATDMHSDKDTSTVILKNIEVADNLDDDVCTQMYQVPQTVLVEEKGDESDSKDIETDIAETQMYLNATYEIPVSDIGKEEDANINNDVYEDMATQLYTNDDCYDFVSTQLYAIESTNIDNVSTQGYSNILHDNGVVPDDRTDQVSAETISESATHTTSEADAALVLECCSKTAEVVVPDKSSPKEEAISTRSSKKRKRKSVRFSLDGVNMFMHTSELKEEDESEFKRSKREENKMPASQQAKIGVRKSKKSPILKRTSPSVVDLLSVEEIFDIDNDENFSEIPEEKGSTSEKLKATETNIELKEAENENDKLKVHADKKEVNDKKSYPVRLKKSKEICEVEDDPEQSLAIIVNTNGQAVENESKEKLGSNSKANEVVEISQSQVEMYDNLSENIANNENNVEQKVDNKFKDINETAENVVVGGELDIQNVTNFENNSTKNTRSKKTAKPPKPKNERKLKEQSSESNNMGEVNDNPTRSVRSKRHLKSSKFDSVSENVTGNSELNAVVTEDVKEKSEEVTTAHKVPARSKKGRNSSKTESVKENNIVDSVVGSSELNAEVTEEVEEKSEEIVNRRKMPAKSKKSRNPSKTKSEKENNVLDSVEGNSELNADVTGEVEKKSEEVIDGHEVPTRSKVGRNSSKTGSVKENNVADSVVGSSELNAKVTEEVEEKSEEIANRHTVPAKSKRSRKPSKTGIIKENNVLDSVEGNSELNAEVTGEGEKKSEEVISGHIVPARSEERRNSSKTGYVKENNIVDSVVGSSELNAEVTEEVEEKSEEITNRHKMPAKSKKSRNPSKTEPVKENNILDSVGGNSRLSPEVTEEVEEKSEDVTTRHKVTARSKRIRNQSKAETAKKNIILDPVASNSELNLEVVEKSEEVKDKQKIPARSKRRKAEPVKEDDVLDSIADDSELNCDVTEEIAVKSKGVHNTKIVPARSKGSRNPSKIEHVKENNIVNNAEETTKTSRSKRMAPVTANKFTDGDVSSSSKIPVVTKPGRPKRNIKQIKLEYSDDDSCHTGSGINENILKEPKSGRSKRNNIPSETITCGNKDVSEIHTKNEEVVDDLSTESIIKNKTEKKVKSKSKQKDIAHVNNSDKKVNSKVENTTEQLDHNNLNNDIPGIPRRSTSAEKPRVVFTGMNDKSFEKIVTDLGGEVVENVLTATHLVTDKVRRTVKFLCAVARGIHIIHPEWLTSSKTSKVFTACHRHTLNDEVAERQYKFQLHRTLEKASERPLFLNKQIYVTKNVKPDRLYLKEMVESAGGTYVSRLPRNPSEDVIVVSCAEDEKEYLKFVDKGYITCTKEIILTGILRQQLDTKHFSVDNIDDLNASRMSLSDSSFIAVPGSKRKATNIKDSPRKGKRRR